MASPYSHQNTAVEDLRAEAAAVNAVYLEAVTGELVFSPICHSHPIARLGQQKGDWRRWQDFDRWFIERCDKVVVLRLPGWQDSKGVQAEMDYAREICKPVSFFDPRA